jgi:hypothetical protein
MVHQFCLLFSSHIYAFCWFRYVQIPLGAEVIQSVCRRGYRLDDRGSIPNRGSGRILFSSPPLPDHIWGPPSLLTEALFSGVKRPRHEAEHSPRFRPEVKNAWSYTCGPQYVFMAWRLIKQEIRLHGSNFTLHFTVSFRWMLSTMKLRFVDLWRANECHLSLHVTHIPLQQVTGYYFRICYFPFCWMICKAYAEQGNGSRDKTKQPEWFLKSSNKIPFIFPSD